MKTFEKVVAATFLYLTIQILVLLTVIGCHYLYIKEILFIPLWIGGVLTCFAYYKLFK